MAILHGFELLSERALPELNSTAIHYRHAKTGAELLSLVNDDENKVFGIALRTPPRDSTGIAHILEHAVLMSGSRKYPVKDPLMQLLKGSLKTYADAFTYPDKTCYPVASQNRQDFYNLIDVYLDAVLHPRLTPPIFEQEGWHYEIEAADAPLIYKGVVFNEMKGAYSSPDIVLDTLSQRSLFPDSIYGFCSGGDPKHIPDLTYAQLKSFHERYYHPSNARLFFYGDDDPDERLRLLDPYLSAFEPIKVDSMVQLQPRFDGPRRLTRTFAAGTCVSDAKKAMVTVNWMLDEVVDAETELALTVVEHLLIGTPAAPLSKALIDSGLGDDVAGCGLRVELRQPMFSIGLKNVDAADADKVEALVLATLRTLAENGIDRLAVEASLNTIEFRLRENNTGSFPRGIALMLRSLAAWLYDRDPLAPLAFAAPLASVKARVAPGERYFEELIGRYLIDNKHRTTLVLRPDPDHAGRETADERARLAGVRAGMSEADLGATIENAKALKRLQDTPDPPEALAMIPALALSDLPRKNKLIPIETIAARDTRVFYHDLATNGVVYLDIGFDLHVLPADLLPYAALFARGLLETGAGEEDFVRLAQRIGRATGGILPQRWTSAIRDSKDGAAWVFLRAKAVPEKSRELLDILRDVLRNARLDNRERIRQIVLEEKAALEARLVPEGWSFPNMRLRANFNEADWAAEQTGGISYLFFLRKLARSVETEWPAVEAALERIRTALVNRAAMICNVTTDAVSFRRLEPELISFLDALPLSVVAPARWAMEESPRFEGLVIPAKVNYVAKGADLHRLGYRPGGAAQVIRHHLSATWLWEKVRLQGGAYGGFCGFDRQSGVFTFMSYRDPNLLATLDVYDRSADFLREIELDAAQLTRSIIGTIGAIDGYQLPDAKGFSSMQRTLVGDTDEVRQRMRDEIFATRIADFREFADVLTKVAECGRVVVLGSEQAIAAANSERADWLAVSRVL